MKVKPPTEVVEADETASEVETAEESWRRHLLRNQSFVVDAFQVRSVNYKDLGVQEVNHYGCQMAALGQEHSRL